MICDNRRRLASHGQALPPLSPVLSAPHTQGPPWAIPGKAHHLIEHSQAEVVGPQEWRGWGSRLEESGRTREGTWKRGAGRRKQVHILTGQKQRSLRGQWRGRPEVEGGKWEWVGILQTLS